MFDSKWLAVIFTNPRPQSAVLGQVRMMFCAAAFRCVCLFVCGGEFVIGCSGDLLGFPPVLLFSQFFGVISDISRVLMQVS